MGNPLLGRQGKGRYEKITIFNQYLTLSQKWYKIGPLLLWNVNRNSYVIYQILSFPVTFSDPNIDLKVNVK